jgi:hypothetical protein
MSDDSPRIDRRAILENAQASESNRRSVLRAAATSVLGALGLTGSATAAHTDLDTDAMQAAAREYHDAGRVRDAVATHVGDLLVELADRGLLDAPSVSELPVESIRGVDALGRGVEGAAVAGVERDGDATTRIQIQKRVSDRAELVVTVLPDEGETMASVRPVARGGSLGALDGTTTVSPSSHCSDCSVQSSDCEVYCGPYSCSCRYAWYYDCGSHGTCCEWGDSCGSCSESGC